MVFSPIEVTAVVDRLPAETFDAFVFGISDWWPLDTHSVGPYLGDPAPDTVVMERHEGGRIFEVSPNGEQRLWGEFLEFDDGAKLSFSWYPGLDKALATIVTVCFEGTDDGKTVVTLTHDGWEARGADAASMRENYVSGWKDIIKNRFVSFVSNR